MPRELHRSWIWLIPVLLVTCGLGARMLNADLIWYDEAWTLFNTGAVHYGPLSPGEIWQRVTTVDPAGMGLGYYYPVAVWQHIVGAAPFVLRAYSLLTGLLTVAVTYRFGSTLFSVRVGWYAAAVLGTSAFFVGYLHEGRAYTQLALFTVFTIAVYWRLLTARVRPTRWNYALLTIGLAGLLYTHYLALFVGASLGFYHLLFGRKDERWWRIVVAMLSAGLLYLPWLPITLGVINAGAEDTFRQAASFSTREALATLANLLSHENNALLALLLILAAQVRQRRSGFVWFVSVSLLLLILLTNQIIPFLLHARYFIILWPGFALLIALGIRQLAETRLAPGIVLAVWVGIGLWHSWTPDFFNDIPGSEYRIERAGFSQALVVLAEQATADDVLVFHTSPPGREFLSLLTEHRGHPVRVGLLDYYLQDIPAAFAQMETIHPAVDASEADYAQAVEAFVDDAPFVWTVTVPQMDSTWRKAAFYQQLTRTYAQCGTPVDRDDLELQRFARQPHTADIHFNVGDRVIALTNLYPERSSTAVQFEVTLAWVVDGDLPPNQYSVALHVDNAAGQLVTQADYSLPVNPFTCTTTTLSLVGQPAGAYMVYVVVYDWRTGERMSGTRLTDDETGDRLLLTTVHVES